MTDEVLDRARADGFELVDRTCGDAWVHGWVRGDDERWLCYLEWRQAVDWMADRLRRSCGALFRAPSDLLRRRCRVSVAR